MKNTTDRLKDRVLSFPSGKTYEQILLTHIHAHPVKKGFPKQPTEYVMFREKGGKMDRLFRVAKTIDLYISDILSEVNLKQRMDASDADRIRRYVFERKQQSGFKYLNEYPYRFYILETTSELCPPIIKSPNIQGYCYYKWQEVIDRCKHGESSTRIEAKA